MNWLPAIPMVARLAALFLLGAVAGSLVNLGIYRLAWHPRRISPLGPAEPGALPRRLTDRLPIVGWLGLRREASLHGRGFWIRPMLLELLLGAGFAALYWWEIGRQGLLPPDTPPLRAELAAILHLELAAHLLLLGLMLVASVIDLDERIIPDGVTVPGTWLGLALAAALPNSLLPALDGPWPAPFWNLLDPNVWPFLRLTSPNAWPAWLDGFPQGGSLAVGLGCWWLWTVALMPRLWYTYFGYRKAVGLLLAKLARSAATYRLLAMGAIGSVAIAAVWVHGGRAWAGLLSGLVGMAAAGTIVWLIRIIGTAALSKEAMGFGDVTLMAMIGTFLGWQTCLVVFFLAPFAGLVLGALQLLLLRDHEIPYGPFLCLAALAVVVGWAAVWDRLGPVFGLGMFVPAVVLCCVALMAVMLGAWRLLRDALWRPRD